MSIRKPLIILFVVLVAGTVAVQAQDWKKIGAKSLDLKLDRDSVVVTSRNRSFTRIKVSVSGASVYFRRMVIIYVTGEKQTFNTPVTVENGDSTPEIDLVGKKSHIERIDLLYESRSFSGKKTRVKIYGMPAP